MTAGAHLLVLVLLIWALRSRLPWTRAGGLALAVGCAGLVSWAVGQPEIRQRLMDVDRWPALLFAAIALPITWWTLHREQVLETPLHETAELESLTHWLNRSWWPILGLGGLLLTVAVLPLGVGPPPGLLTRGGAAVTGHAPTLGVPWFLAGLDELSRLVGPFLAWVVLPAAAVAGLALAPFLDTSHPETEGPFRGRRDEAPFFLWAWLGLGMMPMLSALFVPPRPRISPFPLAETLWLDGIGQPVPTAALWRELPGLLIVLVIFGLLPHQLPRWRATRGVFGRHLRRLGPRRYLALAWLLGLFVLVPVSLLFRTLGWSPWFSLGPVVLGGGP